MPNCLPRLNFTSWLALNASQNSSADTSATPNTGLENLEPLTDVLIHFCSAQVVAKPILKLIAESMCVKVSL